MRNVFRKGGIEENWDRNLIPACNKQASCSWHLHSKYVYILTYR